MALSKEEVRSLLVERGLRATASRLAVLQVLASVDRPLSHSEVLQELGDIDCDPATVFRNLVKLKEAGLAPVVSRIDGIDRYVLNTQTSDLHRHPHFSCNDCGQLICLPQNITNTQGLDEPWAKAIQMATIQLSGQCPDCWQVSLPS